mmetsp:Transcript_11082/g.23873  ORF Transcript_11082/g.23873 Transcript_11082/m.23873 type:complete len:290 (-) Transcript_11082:210-1079(-)
MDLPVARSNDDVPSGTQVELYGLQKAPELNGARGVVSSSAAAADLTRRQIHLASGSTMEIKFTNLKIAPELTRGDQVVLVGLQGASHLNGLEASVVGWQDDRLIVQYINLVMRNSETKALKPTNLVYVRAKGKRPGDGGQPDAKKARISSKLSLEVRKDLGNRASAGDTEALAKLITDVPDLSLKIVAIMAKATAEQNSRHRGLPHSDHGDGLTISIHVTNGRNDGILRRYIAPGEKIGGDAFGPARDAIEWCKNLCRKYQRTEVLPMIRSDYGDLAEYLQDGCTEKGA